VGFVHPASGRTIFPLATTVSIPLFEVELAEYARQVGASPEQQIVLVLDRAGWHTSLKVRVPEPVHLLFLPPYAPELQPTGHLWLLTNAALVNQHFASIEDSKTPSLPTALPCNSVQTVFAQRRCSTGGRTASRIDKVREGNEVRASVLRSHLLTVLHIAASTISKEYFVTKPHCSRHAPAALYSSALIALALCLALAGCGTATNATGDGAASTETATAALQATATDTPQPSSPQPTPLPIGTFTTYTNTAYGYSISYPQNWSVEGGSATSQGFMVTNYNPQTYQQPLSAPPLLKIEIDAAPNPSNLSTLDFFKQSSSGAGEPTITIQSSQATTLAGRNAEQVISTSSASQYPTITYLIAKGDTMLLIYQINAANGQPSPIFTQMLASLAITG
jgi:hypothetical protein